MTDVAATQRLTQYSHGAGCGCKLAPSELVEVVKQVGGDRPEALLVGSSSGDDAAVWQLDDERALVSTIDFITPVVDDPRWWGRVAAANAVSDVYAMGGRPLFALNAVAWNSSELPREMLAEVLAGGEDIARAGGFAIVGGHTVDDPEPKYGLAVTGEVHPDRVLTNAGLKPGQDLILTKPLGVGITTTAIKAGAASDGAIDTVLASMTKLNDKAAEAALAAGATGCTDVTGFGLFGHLGRMAGESQVDVTIVVEDVPFMPGIRKLAEEGWIPGGTRRNLAWVADRVNAGDHDELTQLMLADAQTSGGLVFGVDPSQTASTLTSLTESGHTAAHIGHTSPGTGEINLL